MLDIKSLAKEKVDPMLSSPSWAPSRIHGAHHIDAPCIETPPPISSPSSASSNTDQIVPPTHKTNRLRGYGRSCWSWPWMSEVFALLLGLIALLSVPATLLPHHGKPIPQWPISISINALLAIYAAALKACLAWVIQASLGQLAWILFSNTPRSLRDFVRLQGAGSGGWDTWTWLWPARRLARQTPLVSLGALMAILTIFTDPFMQQLVHPRGCERERFGAESLASLPRTSYFDHSRIGLPDKYQLLPELQDAIVYSAFGTPEALRGQCPTGNCTFPEFSTLGYCSTCDDISSSLLFNYGCRDYNYTSSREIVGEDVQEEFLVKMSSSVSSLCNDSFSVLHDVVETRLSSDNSNMWDYGGTRPVRDVQFNLVKAKWLGWDKTLTYEIIVGQTPFSVRGLDSMTGQRLQNCEARSEQQDIDQGNWRCNGYGAARCQLYPCVRTYQTSTWNGVITEETIDRTGLEDVKSFLDPLAESLNLLVNTECASTSERQWLAERGLDINKLWVPLNYSSAEFEPGITTLDTFPASLFDRNCAYMWPKGQHTSLFDFLHGNNFLGGKVKATTRRDPDLKLYFYTQYPTGPREMLRLYNHSAISFDTVRDTFEDLATGLTNYVRTHGHRNYSEPQLGTTWHHSICLDIRWPWIAMPATLWLGVAALLCYAIVITSRRDVPVWKASPLPLLFRGPLVQVEGSGLNGEGESETVLEMEKKAERIVVQLDRVHGEVSLRELSASLGKP